MRLPVILLTSLILTGCVATAQTAATMPFDGCATLKIESVDTVHFWQAWDLWQSRDKGDPKKLTGLLQTEYLDKGSPGLKDFIPHRIQSAQNLSEAILDDPSWYRDARPLPEQFVAHTAELRAICRDMQSVDPALKMPTVYLIMGARSSGGTSTDSGLLLGVEMYSQHPGARLKPEDFVGLVTHELDHFQQQESGHNTLLRQAMVEGSADFIAEHFAGRNGDESAKAYADAHEQELWGRFSREMHQGKTENWLYNFEQSTAAGVPADLGYYEGYKICQSFFERATDKIAALRSIMLMADEEAILQSSGYGERFR